MWRMPELAGIKAAHMDPLFLVAQALGVVTGAASNAAYDFLKTKFGGKTAVTAPEFQSALTEFLTVHGVTASAETVMTLLAQRGVLQVTDSRLHAKQSLEFGASGQGKFVVGNNTRTSTDKTAIEAGQGAFITGQNAAVRQNADGSVSFQVGSNPGDKIEFWTKK